MIFDCFFDEQDNHILWLPVFFVIGCFIGFNSCIKSYIYLPIVFISLISLIYTNKYLIRYLSIICIFISLGLFRSYNHINNYKYPDVKYNLGKVQIIGKIDDKMLKFQDNGELSRYITVEIESIKPINKNSRFSKDKDFKDPKFLRIKMFDNGNVEYGKVQIEANVLPIQNKNFDSDFDLQMYFYFKKIGGLGYNGKILKYLEKQDKLTIKQLLSNFREKVAIRILSVKKDSLSMNLLSIIITGQRNLANKDMLKIMNKSGLSHIMSISGLHMVILTFAIVFIIKQIFSLYNNAFIRYNVYKVSAVVSIFVNTFYILLSGFSISSTRAYIMNIIMLIGILLDRFNSPLRSIMFTMFIMVFVKPNLIYRAGFYMSFLSSIAIIAFIDYYYIYKYNESNYIEKNNFLKNLKVALIISVIIELVVLPIEIYSFNMLSFFNIIINVIINPLMSFIVVPFGLLSLLLMPLRLEKIILLPVSYLIDCIIYMAKIFNKIRFGTVFLQSPNIFTVVLMIFGILWLSLWSNNWRRFGVIPYLIGIFMILSQKNIDVIIDNKDKMLFFVDERNNIYVYNMNGYKTQNIINKLGNGNFFDLNNSHLNTCKNSDDKYCSKIDIRNDDTINFYKNGNSVTIGRYKGYFYEKDKIGKIKIEKTRKKSDVPKWKTCSS